MIPNLLLSLFLLISPPQAAAAQAPAAQQPQVQEWADDFSAAALDETKWERFTFEGTSGGTLKLDDGILKLRGMSGSRSGVRSRQSFSSERFIFEAKIQRVGERVPDPRSNDSRGFAVMAVLFGGSERNRIEWIMRSDGLFEAWLIRDGRQGERLDNQKLGTREKQPTLAIVRRGNEILFVLNGEIGLTHRAEGLQREFHVMLYGFGSTDAQWDSVRVVIAK